MKIKLLKKFVSAPPPGIEMGMTTGVKKSVDNRSSVLFPAHSRMSFRHGFFVV
jgi:hypothetical protein